MNLITITQKLNEQFKAARPELFDHSVSLEVNINTYSKFNKYRFFAMAYLQKQPITINSESIYMSAENHSLKKAIAMLSEKMQEIKDTKPEIIEP